MDKVNLLAFDLDGLAAWCATLGEKRFRAVQLYRWVHQRGVADFEQMSDLARPYRERLSTLAEVRPLAVASEQASADGTVKWLFDVGGGNAVETVFIPEADRGTLCISSQAGCAVGCPFCSTGAQGFSRNLSTAEILGQLWHAEHALRKRYGSGEGVRPAQGRSQAAARPSGADAEGVLGRMVTNVVMMGMGEPLQNYAALVPALRTMLHDHGYGLSRRRVTVSTSGMARFIDRLGQECPVALAVSLHAPTDALRDRLVPLNRKHPLADLFDACQRYLAVAPRDFITFEYCMLDGVNDSDEHARQLVALVQGRAGAPRVACKFNLIPFNPFPGSGLLRSPRERVTAFAAVLQEAGIVTTIRKTRGDDIAAACGQLAGEVQDRTRLQQRRGAAVPVAVVRREPGVAA